MNKRSKKSLDIQKIDDFGFMELEIGKVYAQWIYSLFTPHLGKVILDVGSGLGLMLAHYQKNGRIVLASDINKKYVRIMKYRFKKYKNIRVLQFDISKLTQPMVKRLKAMNIDTVTSVNVFEHIREDEYALKNVYKLLSKDSKLILFVPALPVLFGSIDESFGHFRRYTKQEITEKLTKVGFRIVNIRYFNSLGILWWFFTGRILRMKNFPRATGYILRVVVPLLQRLEAHINPPIGQSLIVIAKK